MARMRICNLASTPFSFFSLNLNAIQFHPAFVFEGKLRASEVTYPVAGIRNQPRTRRMVVRCARAALVWQQLAGCRAAGRGYGYLPNLMHARMASGWAPELLRSWNYLLLQLQAAASFRQLCSSVHTLSSPTVCHCKGCTTPPTIAESVVHTAWQR